MSVYLETRATHRPHSRSQLEASVDGRNRFYSYQSHLIFCLAYMIYCRRTSLLHSAHMTSWGRHTGVRRHAILLYVSSLLIRFQCMSMHMLYVWLLLSRVAGYVSGKLSKALALAVGGSLLPLQVTDALQNVCYPPWKRDIVFGLSVCPRPFFSFCARNSSHSFLHTQTNLYHLKAGCLECVMGSRFALPPKFRRSRSLKTAQECDTFTIWKPCFRHLTNSVCPYVQYFRQKWFLTSMMHSMCALIGRTSIRQHAVSLLQGDCLHRGNFVNTHIRTPLRTKILAKRKNKWTPIITCVHTRTNAYTCVHTRAHAYIHMRRHSYIVVYSRVREARGILCTQASSLDCLFHCGWDKSEPTVW